MASPTGGAGGDRLEPAAAARPLRRRRSWRQRAPVWGFQAGEAVVAVLPRRVADVIGGGIAAALVTMAPRRFDALRDNLRHVVPDADDKAMTKLVRQNVRNWARSWTDVLEMRSHPKRVTDRLTHFSGLHNYLEAVAEGRGVVVVSLHYGTWEAGLAAWNQVGGDLALLAEKIEPPELFERLVGSRGALGVKVFPIDVAAMRSADPATSRRVGAAALRDVIKHLRGGGVIAIAIDRDLIGNGEPLPFFGRLAPIPLGTVDIAMRAGAAIVPIVLERHHSTQIAGAVYPRISYDPAAPRADEVRRVALEILKLCEEVIRLHPDQWHVMDRVWTLPDGGAMA